MDTPLITSDPAVMLGKPVVAGTRITVELILSKLGAGESMDQLLDSHPRLTRAAILFTVRIGEEYGYQDGRLSTTQFSYTGEGQAGDMEMARSNQAIQRHAADSRELHLFEKTDSGGHCRHLGPFRNLSHQLRRGRDVDGDEPSQIVFTLELVVVAAPGSAKRAEPDAAADGGT